MDPLSIIKDLNPFCNGSSSLPMSLEGMTINQFGLQGSQETFCNCIVPRQFLQAGEPRLKELPQQFARRLILQVILAVLRAAR
jgi:hypothetical protein